MKLGLLVRANNRDAKVLGMQTCAVSGCDRPIKRRGWCNAHYLRWWFHGDPLIIKNNRGKTPYQRFIEKVDHTENGCWQWTGTITRKGYGLFHDEKMVAAHRWAYLHFVGSIPDGLQVDHLCRNRSCVNVEHMDIVTNRENVIRGNTARGGLRSHCDLGHEYTEANTIHRRDGQRACRQCARDLKKAWRQRQKERGRPR